MIDFKKYISELCARAEEMLRKGAELIPGEKGGLPFALSARRSRHVAWIVMFGGLMISAAVALYMKSSADEIAEKDFIFHCREIQNTISGRLYDHARILRSGAAFF